jgi:hypothetical protein
MMINKVGVLVQQGIPTDALLPIGIKSLSPGPEAGKILRVNSCLHYYRKTVYVSALIIR